jgi:GlcNAc-P-P-Und epimerase
MKIVNVVGGSGFVGTRLVTRLLPNFDVKVIDKNPSIQYPTKFLYSDVRSANDLYTSLCEDSVIINLAAEHRDDVSPKILYDEVNIDGAKNICDVARHHKINKIIFTSSVAVYGFSPLGTDESGKINPFNDYGRTKWGAEKIYKEWQSEDPTNRTLVIVRPTVIFGERNRGNVFNLLKQIASGKFVMVGNGLNRKSMAYVENVAAFLEYSLCFKPGIYVYNYIDKPDFTMNHLVGHVNKLLGRTAEIKIRLPFWLGFSIGKIFDVLAFLFKKKFSISSIRVKKFCANSVYESAIDKTGFVAPVPLLEALEKTVKYEFIEDHKSEQVFYTE